MKIRIDQVKEKFGGRIREIAFLGPSQVFVTVGPEDHVDVCGYLFRDMKGRFATATGIDGRDAIEVLYHFCFDSDHFVLTVKTWADKPEVELESVTPVVPAANWIEREMYDLLGVVFKNHPRLERLILSDDWPEGVYPLRRDFTHEGQ